MIPSIYDWITVDLNGATAQQKQRLLAAIVGLVGDTRLEGETDAQLANRYVLDFLVSVVKGYESKLKEQEKAAAHATVDNEWPKE